MSPEVGGTAVLLVGIVLARLSLTDVYQRYVRVAMGPWLLLAGVLLAVLGAVALLRALRRPAGTADPHHAHDPHPDHHHEPGGDRVGWLLLAPVVVLLLVAPPALGSFGVARSTVTVGSGGQVFATLPAAAGPRAMTLLEFGQRSADRAGASFGGRPVTLTGFVAEPTDGAGFRLARYQIACCAADAAAAVARVVGADAGVPARDTWLTVVGTFRGLGSDGVPELAAASVQEIAAPVDPYE